MGAPETKILRLDDLKNSVVIEEAMLVVEEPASKQRVFDPNKSEIIIGSREDCDLVLHDEYVSGRHARLVHQDGAWELFDLGSTNGTFVGGKKITQIKLPLEVEATLGQTRLKLKSQMREEKVVPSPQEHFCGMTGSSKAMQLLYAKIQRLAPTDSTVLIQGDTGTGKELVVRALHQLSGRASKPLIILNCGAISDALIESELFGHEKGAFTGAVTRRVGAFEEAHGGTLFLDEVGELPLELQPKLLRILENQTIRRVGSNLESPVDVRVLAASHKNLAELVKQGKFREDLYFRLFVVPLKLPPLCDREDDIPLIAQHFLALATKGAKQFSAAALEKLQAYHWPGNVRELKNVVSRSLIYADGIEIGPENVQLSETSSGVTVPMSPVVPPSLPSTLSHQTLSQVEKSNIEEALRKTEGNKTKAAELLGIAKSTLFKKLKDYDIPL